MAARRRGRRFLDGSSGFQRDGGRLDRGRGAPAFRTQAGREPLASVGTLAALQVHLRPGLPPGSSAFVAGTRQLSIEEPRREPGELRHFVPGQPPRLRRRRSRHLRRAQGRGRRPAQPPTIGVVFLLHDRYGCAGAGGAFCVLPARGGEPRQRPALSSQLCPQIIQPDSPPETREA